MLVEIWSDIVCPFCYIGKRQFEKALAQFDRQADVQIVYKSFELNPAASKKFPGNLHDYLANHKGVSVHEAKKMNDNVSAYAADVGLHYDLDHAHPANSFDAHRLVHLAAKHNLADAMIETLHRAYFVEAGDIGNTEALVRYAVGVGLDEQETRKMLASDELADAVRADEAQAQEFAIDSVPCFVFDRTFSVVGAQDSETFLKALREAGKKT